MQLNRSVSRAPRPDKTYTAWEVLLRNPLLYPLALLVLVAAPVAIVALLYWTVWDYVVWALSNQLVFSILIMLLSIFIILHICAAAILFERKLSAYIQDRHGPNRVGFWGILQPIADGAKFLLKEDVLPSQVDKPMFILAPFLAFVVALIGFAVIPWAGDLHLPGMAEGQTVSTQVANVDVGLLYMIAVASLGVYGVVLAGWASNSKYAFYGGMRAAAQMISYEVPLGLALMVVLLVAGTLKLDEMVNQQIYGGFGAAAGHAGWLGWNVFLQPIAFILVLIGALAETNRAPFDLAECEQELVAGYHTEYSSMKFALFYLGEYSHMTTNSALMTALFFGGYDLWPGPDFLDGNVLWWAVLLKFGIFWAKVSMFLGFYIVIRWTLPRFRFDQLMRLAWTMMVPLGVALVVGTAVLVWFGWERALIPSVILNVVLVVLGLWAISRSHVAVTGRQENLPSIAPATMQASSMTGPA